MTRRNGSAAKALALSGGFMLIVFAIYSYHALSTELKKTSEKADRLRQQHDSLSAQLQVVYEHKGRLEKMLQEEQQNHQKTKDETSKQRRSTDDKYTKEKEDLLERINSITQQKNMLESRNEDLQAEYDKLQGEVQKLTDDNNQREEQNNAEFQLLKQTSANEVAQLKDQIADLQRQNNELMQQVQQAGQNNANLQNQASEAAQSVQRLQQQVNDLQNKQNAAANQNNPLLGNQAALGNQNAQFNQAGNAAVPQAGADAQNPLVGLQQQNQEHLQQAGDHGNQDAPAAMQINKPGDEKKAYFVPKAPVNEGELHVKESQGAGEGHPDEGHQQQVAPPDVGEDMENEEAGGAPVDIAAGDHRHHKKMAEEGLAFRPAVQIGQPQQEEPQLEPSERTNLDHLDRHADNAPIREKRDTDEQDKLPPGAANMTLRQTTFRPVEAAAGMEGLGAMGANGGGAKMEAPMGGFHGQLETDQNRIGRRIGRFNDKMAATAEEEDKGRLRPLHRLVPRLEERVDDANLGGYEEREGRGGVGQDQQMGAAPNRAGEERRHRRQDEPVEEQVRGQHDGIFPKADEILNNLPRDLINQPNQQQQQQQQKQVAQDLNPGGGEKPDVNVPEGNMGNVGQVKGRKHRRGNKVAAPADGQDQDEEDGGQNNEDEDDDRDKIAKQHYYEAGGNGNYQEDEEEEEDVHNNQENDQARRR